MVLGLLTQSIAGKPAPTTYRLYGDLCSLRDSAAPGRRADSHNVSANLKNRSVQGGFNPAQRSYRTLNVTVRGSFTE